MTSPLDGMRVQHGALDQASADMLRTVTDIDDRMNRLEAELEPVHPVIDVGDRMNRLEAELEPLRSAWAGHAQQSYIEAKATWDRAIGEMRDLLDESQRTVLRSNAEYQAVDRRGAARFVH